MLSQFASNFLCFSCRRVLKLLSVALPGSVLPFSYLWGSIPSWQPLTSSISPLFCSWFWEHFLLWHYPCSPHSCFTTLHASPDLSPPSGHEDGEELGLHAQLCHLRALHSISSLVRLNLSSEAQTCLFNFQLDVCTSMLIRHHQCNTLETELPHFLQGLLLQKESLIFPKQPLSAADPHSLYLSTLSWLFVLRLWPSLHLHCPYTGLCSAPWALLVLA